MHERNNIRHKALLFACSFSAAVLITILMASCDDNIAGPENQNEIARVVMSPDNASIEVGETIHFSLVALTASGDTLEDVLQWASSNKVQSPGKRAERTDITVKWWSTDPSVFTVEENGIATGQGTGTAYCKIKAIERVQTAGKTGGTRIIPILWDSAFVAVF